MEKRDALDNRSAPLEISPAEFREIRTSLEDIEALPGIVVRLGRQVDAALRPEELKLKERNNQ